VRQAELVKVQPSPLVVYMITRPGLDQGRDNLGALVVVFFSAVLDGRKELCPRCTTTNACAVWRGTAGENDADSFKDGLGTVSTVASNIGAYDTPERTVQQGVPTGNQLEQLWVCVQLLGDVGMESVPDGEDKDGKPVPFRLGQPGGV